jgi:hypothetical protein
VLHVGILGSGDGLPQLAHAAHSLAPSLRSLSLRGGHAAAASGSLNFLGALTRLERLELHGLPSSLEQAPAWLAKLARLTFLDVSCLCLSASRVAEALAPLNRLRELRFLNWKEGDAPLRSLPACGSVTSLRCIFEPAGAASLAAAFLSVDHAHMMMGDSPAPPPPAPSAPRWSALRSCNLVNQARASVILRALQALGALGGSLQRLTLMHWQGPGVQPVRTGDAELIAILAAAPALEALKLETDAITDTALALYPRLASLKSLLLCGFDHDTFSLLSPRFSAAGLLALGAAFPALQMLRLGSEETERACVRQLDALGISGDCEGSGNAVGGGCPHWNLLPAIRGALRRGAGAVYPADPGPSAAI